MMLYCIGRYTTLHLFISFVAIWAVSFELFVNDIIGFLLLLQWNTMTERWVGKERVYFAYTWVLLFITEGNQDRNSNTARSRRQELMERPWRRAAYRLHLACSAHLLIEPRTNSPEMVPSTTGSPPLITNWENALYLELTKAISPTELLALTLACVKLSHKSSQYRQY